ncbi:unnamed protein product [Urochloa humidicola]
MYGQDPNATVSRSRYCCNQVYLFNEQYPFQIIWSISGHLDYVSNIKVMSFYGNDMSSALMWAKVLASLWQWGCLIVVKSCVEEFRVDFAFCVLSAVFLQACDSRSKRKVRRWMPAGCRDRDSLVDH